MKFLLFIFFFLIYFSNSYSKTNCTGFCKGEKYILNALPDIEKDVENIGNTKYKTWTYNRGLAVENSNCMPFFTSLVFERNNKKNFAKDIAQVPWKFRNDINICLPCTDFWAKNGFEGFCLLTYYRLDVVYKGAVKNNFPPKDYRDQMWWWYRGNNTIIGRDYDLPADFSNHQKDILAEFITFTIDPKNELRITKFIDKEFGELYAYQYASFKTPLKQQVSSASDLEMIEDEEAIELINTFIKKLMTSTSEFYAEDGIRKILNFGKFYGTIPTDDEIKRFSEYFPELSKFHIQRRE